MTSSFVKACVVFLSAWLVISASAREENRVFFSYDASNGLADNSAQIVMCTKTGRIVVTTIGHVNFFDGSGFAHVDPRMDDAVALPGYDGRYQIYFDKFHHLWMKHDRLMTCVDLLTERFVSDVPAVLREQGVTEPVDDIFGDGESNVWFLSGRRLYSPSLEKSFEVRHASPVRDVDLYNDSLLLMFHADGAVTVNDYRRQRQLYVDEPFSPQERNRFSQSSELCLVGHQYYHLHNGDHEAVMLRYDVDRRQWDRLLETPFHMNALYPIDDVIYIGTERGYIVYNYLTGEREHVETLTLTKGRRQLADISSLCFDRQGGLWIGTSQRGLLYAKPFTSPFHVYNLDSPEGQRFGRLMDQLPQGESLPRKVNCLFRDSRGWRWTGSYSGVTMERPDGTQLTFTAKDGLPNEVVHSIIEDNQHRIWVSTSYGVACLYVRDGAVYHLESYINQDNVPNEAFLNGRAVKLADGTIVLQSLDHYMVFDPARFQSEQLGQIPLLPKLIRLVVNGTEVEAGSEVDGRVILERAASRTREFSVDYDQNSLSMTFSGLNYLRPLQTYYRVRVKGVPAYDHWRVLSYGKSGGMVDNRGQLHLSLLSLPPGRYEIELQASLWPEVWPQEPYVWVLHVEQPWWRTTGLYLLLGLLLLGMLMLNVYFFNRNMRLRLLRNNAEADILKRVKNFVARCEGMKGEVLTPYTPSADGEQLSGGVMSSGFIDAMLKIVPFVADHAGQRFTMSDLASVAGVETSQLYGLLAPHLDKNPRALVGSLRLQDGARLLRTSDLSVEAIAEQLGFVSPNYFMASFYHQYRQTPLSYRSSTAL